MTGEQKVNPQAAPPASGLDRLAEGMLGQLVLGDLPEVEKADILSDLADEMRALRVLAAQQHVVLVSMQNMLAVWNNSLLRWATDEKGRAFKGVMRELNADGLTPDVDLLEVDPEIADMVEQLSAEMGEPEPEPGEPGEDEGAGEEGPVIDADFREVPTRKSGNKT